MKQIMMPIKPKWVAKILSGEKTIEIRKTAPKEWIDYLNGKTDKKPAPMIVNIYCTKGDYIGFLPKRCVGKVIARFCLTKIEKITLPYTKFGTKEPVGCEWERTLQTKTMDEPDILNANRIGDADSIYQYLFSKGKNHGYAWHISDLRIFNPKELSNFLTLPKKVWHDYESMSDYYERRESRKLKRAPRGWCYVEEIK